WSAVGAGIDGDVNALTVYDDGSGPALYAGGLFTHAGGVEARSIAKWDGSTLSNLQNQAQQGDGLLGQVFSLAVFDDGAGHALYAGGIFELTGGNLVVNRIAKWDGTR